MQDVPEFMELFSKAYISDVSDTPIEGVIEENKPIDIQNDEIESEIIVTNKNKTKAKLKTKKSNLKVNEEDLFENKPIE